MVDGVLFTDSVDIIPPARLLEGLLPSPLAGCSLEVCRTTLGGKCKDRLVCIVLPQRSLYFRPERYVPIFQHLGRRFDTRGAVITTDQ